MIWLLLLLPVIIAVVSFLTDRERITVKEFLFHLGLVTLVIGISYGIALASRSDDTELWNGVIARKWTGTENCCHSYPCNCTTSCTGGKTNICSTTCQTCYEHSHDVYWAADTSNGERVYTNGCNSPGSSAPGRWEDIRMGEPTAVEHAFTNYLQANPDSILRRQGAQEKYAGKIPKYPEVYDYYRAQRFLGGDAWANERLNKLNATLGAPKQVNVIVVATTQAPDYGEAIADAWVGGKKNDVIVVIGMFGNRAGWAKVISWSKAEEMKLAIRDGILNLPVASADGILDVIEKEVGNKFVRRDWHDFDYLKSTIEPSSTVQLVLFILGTALSVGLKFVMSKNDVFGEEGRKFRYNRW